MDSTKTRISKYRTKGILESQGATKSLTEIKIIKKLEVVSFEFKHQSRRKYIPALKRANNVQKTN